jgi:hypothetical protein
MGPHDYGREHGMIHGSKTKTSALAEQEARVAQACPNWEAWPISHHDRRVSWSARPEGASVAVITDAPGSEEVIAAVKAYEAELPRRLEDLKRQLAGAPHTSIGRDKIAVLESVVAALENLAEPIAARGEM